MDLMGVGIGTRRMAIEYSGSSMSVVQIREA